MNHKRFRKRMCAVMLSCCVLVTLLTGCGTDSNPTNHSSESDNTPTLPSESEDIHMTDTAQTTAAELGDTGMSETEQTASMTEESENTDTAEYAHRVILVSDMHYTTEETADELKQINPDFNTSAAAGNAFGYTQKGKIDCVVNDIQAFMKNETVDAVLVLGDLSLDDYGFRTLPDNYLQKCKEDFMDQLSCPSYAIPGNHDSYPNKTWKEIFGYDRQYSIKIGDAVFIMLDTFEAQPSSSASGSAYCGIDTEFLAQELEKYPTEQIFLCTHYVDLSKSNHQLAKLLRENDRIVCLFDAHTHKNKVLLPDGLDKRFLVNIGGYAYQGEKIDGKWIFNRFDEAWAWGYTVLEWNDTEAHLYHVKPARKYVGSNGEFYYPGAIEDELTIRFKN